MKRFGLKTQIELSKWTFSHKMNLIKFKSNTLCDSRAFVELIMNVRTFKRYRMAFLRALT
jgi:hypothetical protein